MKMKINSLQELYIHELRDLLSAEQQLSDAMPKMARAAPRSRLAAAILDHLEETRKQAERLTQVLAGLNERADPIRCEGMAGLIKEGEEMLSLKGDDEVRAAGIIVAAQKIEHYEIAAYGSLCAFARLLGRRDDLPLLEQSLAEEKRADATLTEIASASVNREAASTDARP